jgi:hypothetical protein
MLQMVSVVPSPFVFIARKPPVPQVPWMRFSNMARAALLWRIQSVLPQIVAGFACGDTVIEIK